MANLVDYVKSVWENGKTALNAARMNNMEQGISNCASQINKLGDSVSPLFRFMTNDKTRISLTFESSNHSSALLFLDNNGDPSIIYLNCYDSTSKVIAGSNLNITFEGKNKAVVQSTQWSFGFALVTYGEDCSISVM